MMDDQDGATIFRFPASAIKRETIGAVAKPAVDLSKYAAEDLIGFVLSLAETRYHAHAPKSDVWDFTIHAMLYLSDWLANMQPELSREFLEALADNAGALTHREKDRATTRVAEAVTALRQAIRTQGSNA